MAKIENLDTVWLRHPQSL